MMVAAACGGALDNGPNEGAEDAAVQPDATQLGQDSAGSAVVDSSAFVDSAALDGAAADGATRESAAADGPASIVDGAQAPFADASDAADANDEDGPLPYPPPAIYKSPPRRSVWS
jgi:hypothetical protein